MRPEVRQQREVVSFALRPHLVSVGRVDRDREDLHIVVLERRELVANRAELALADTGEGQGVEQEYDVTPPAELRECDLLVVLITQGEVRGDAAHVDGHWHILSTVTVCIRIRGGWPPVPSMPSVRPLDQDPSCRRPPVPGATAHDLLPTSCHLPRFPISHTAPM